MMESHAEQPPVDLDRLHEVTLGEADLLEEVIGIFLEDGRACLVRLREAVASDALDDARRDAHTLKGMAGNLGAMPLLAMARRLELAAEQRDAAALPGLLAALESEFDRAAACFQQQL